MKQQSGGWVAAKILLLVVGATAMYTHIGQLVPQKEVLAPTVIEIDKSATPEDLVDIGKEISEGKGLCRTCHTIGKSGALRFPDLGGIATVAATRIEGMDALTYLANSIYHPDDYIVPGFVKGMPAINKPPIGLTDDEMISVIAYLQSLGGTPTVTLDLTRPIWASSEAGMNLIVIVGCLLLLGLVRLRNPGTLGWAFAWWIALYVFIQYGFKVPVPGSVASIYMAIATGAIFTYVTSSRERMQGFTGPIKRLVTDPARRTWLALVLVAVPAIAALNVWAKMNIPLEAPAFGRTIHPAPPDTISVHEQEISLITADNPYRHYETSDPEKFKQHVENGRRVYFQNCFWCHGDGMRGDGMFAHGLNPIPTTFTDQGIIPQLQESFLFWRVAKGGPGLPEESGPWDTAMPAWEKFLTEEEMWDVVTFLSDFTGFTPRARGEHAEGH